jgi:hypothetical protein
MPKRLSLGALLTMFAAAIIGYGITRLRPR